MCYQGTLKNVELMEGMSPLIQVDFLVQISSWQHYKPCAYTTALILVDWDFGISTIS